MDALCYVVFLCLKLVSNYLDYYRCLIKIEIRRGDPSSSFLKKKSYLSNISNFHLCLNLASLLLQNTH